MRVIRCDRCSGEVSTEAARHVTVHQPGGNDEGWDFCEHCLNEILEWITAYKEKHESH